VELSGTGSVVCYNRIRNYRNGIRARRAPPVRAIDFHNNDISKCTDGGIGLDHSEHNTRAYFNRITNTVTGISFRPVLGGPAYAVRNVLYNAGHEAFRLGVSRGDTRTSGVVIIHNTAVTDGPPLRVWGERRGSIGCLYMRNNLLVGNTGDRAIDITCQVQRPDLDHDAYVAGGTGFGLFAKLNERPYATIGDLAAGLGLERNGVSLDSPAGLFTGTFRFPDTGGTYEPPDLRPDRGAPVVDKAGAIPGVNDAHTGAGPDIGAYELGAPVPRYGVRPRARTPGTVGQ
jgi:hypothetical protein